MMNINRAKLLGELIASKVVESNIHNLEDLSLDEFLLGCVTYGLMEDEVSVALDVADDEACIVFFSSLTSEIARITLRWLKELQ